MKPYEDQVPISEGRNSAAKESGNKTVKTIKPKRIVVFRRDSGKQESTVLCTAAV